MNVILIQSDLKSQISRRVKKLKAGTQIVYAEDLFSELLSGKHKVVAVIESYPGDESVDSLNE